MLNQEFIAKGFYQHKQPNEFVSVKNYIFIRQADQKCLLLRFSNELGYYIDGMRFTLHQFDAAGKLLKKTVLEYNDLHFSADGTLVLNKGILVDEFCTDFKISIDEVRSGQYLYEMNGGSLSVKYIRTKTPLELKGQPGDRVSKIGSEPFRFGKEGLATLFSVIAGLAMLSFAVLQVFL